MQIESQPEYKFPTRLDVANLIRDARNSGNDCKRTKTLGWMPGMPDSVKIIIKSQDQITITLY